MSLLAALGATVAPLATAQPATPTREEAAAAASFDAMRAEVNAIDSIETLLARLRANPADDSTLLLTLRMAALIKEGKTNLAPLVQELMTNPDPAVRAALMMGLWQADQAAAPAIPALLEIAQHDSDERMRGLALHAIERIGTPASAVTPLLTIVKNEEEPLELRLYAAMALDSAGPTAAPAYGAVVELLKTIGDETAGIMLGKTLRRIDNSTEARQSLVALLEKTDDSVVRGGIAAALQGDKPALTSREADALAHALTNERDAQVRNMILRTLAHARTPSPTVIATMTEALRTTRNDQEFTVLTEAASKMRILTSAPILAAYEAALPLWMDQPKPLGDACSFLALTRDPAALRIVLDALRTCGNGPACTPIVNAIARSSPYRPELVADLLEAFRTADEGPLRDALMMALRQADASALPLIEAAEADARYAHLRTYLQILATDLYRAEANRRRQAN